MGVLHIWNEDTGKYEPIPALVGKTPEKGVDYWTADDQKQIVNDVLAALPMAEEAVFGG